jgi:para-nitrobenzyl esterase
MPKRASGIFVATAAQWIANSTVNRPGRLGLSDAMMRSLGAFARTGDAYTPALGTGWPTWPSTLRFDATPDHKAIAVE